MTEDERLAEILSEHGATNCPKCLRIIDRGDLAWNAGDTEAGTPYSTVHIICQRCDTEMAQVFSWYPGMDDFDDVLRVLEEDWSHAEIVG
jgi:hypothetical protein